MGLRGVSGCWRTIQQVGRWLEKADTRRIVRNLAPALIDAPKLVALRMTSIFGRAHDFTFQHADVGPSPSWLLRRFSMRLNIFHRPVNRRCCLYIALPTCGGGRLIVAGSTLAGRITVRLVGAWRGKGRSTIDLSVDYDGSREDKRTGLIHWPVPHGDRWRVHP